MVYYLLRRLVGAVAVLFGVVTGTFVLSHVVPSCPACAVAGLRAGPEQIKAAAHSLGLDRPVWDQYGTYISGLAHGDFGISYRSEEHTSELQSQSNLVCRLLLEKKKKKKKNNEINV